MTLACDGEKAMRRLQIQIDEATYEALRRRAFERRQSLAATVRELLLQMLGRTRPARRNLRRFTFVGAFASGRSDRASEEHDAVLGEGRW